MCQASVVTSAYARANEFFLSHVHPPPARARWVFTCLPLYSAQEAGAVSPWPSEQQCRAKEEANAARGE